MASIEELKNLRNVIDNINPLYHDKIFDLIKEYNMIYSKNKNGIFINMNNLSNECIKKIYEYLEYIKKQEKTFSDVEKIKKEFKKDFFSNIKKYKKSEKLTSVENTSVENTSVENTSVENTSVENTSVENTSVENTSVVKPIKKVKKTVNKYVEIN